jgi:hypothetical protein
MCECMYIQSSGEIYYTQVTKGGIIFVSTPHVRKIRVLGKFIIPK